MKRLFYFFLEKVVRGLSFLRPKKTGEGKAKRHRPSPKDVYPMW